jgi:hypothetical protein
VTIIAGAGALAAKIIGYLNALPGIRRAAIAAARPLWDTGITSKMTLGSYAAIDAQIKSCGGLLPAMMSAANFNGRQGVLYFSQFKPSAPCEIADGIFIVPSG